MKYHLMAFIAGFVIDCILGDPQGWPHPIRWIGGMISRLTDLLLTKKADEMDSAGKRRAGVYLVVIALFFATLVTGILLTGAYCINPYLGVAVEAVMTYFSLASKSLYTESMKVYEALKHGTLDDARYAVSMIVGRDTKVLDETGVAKAAIETVAENTSDGVIAPMIYMAIGGPILGVIYKTINTMDSMVGYKNEKFLDFGRAAAHLDDFVNYIPARISAFFMVAGCFFLGAEYDGKRAFAIFKRDRYNHASPNSAQTESACAGALGIRLAGPASYFGKIVEKPYIGDALRPVEIEDIVRANRLMLMTTVLCEIVCVVLIWSIYYAWRRYI